MITISLELIVSLTAFILTIIGAVWKVSQVVNTFKNALIKLEEHNIARDKYIKEIREQLISLEGNHDGTIKAMISNVRAIEKTSGKVDAMWVTLQRLFPDKVPPRMSDKEQAS